MKRLMIAAAFLLAACSSSPAPVYGPPAPPPVPTVAPSFVAAFSSPSMGIAGWCEQQTPVLCEVPEGTIWASFNRPGNSGNGCGDPNPNECYSVSAGVLVTRADDLGFPLTTVQTFDRTKAIHVRMRTAAHCGSPGCWSGIVIYDGEDDYAAEYWRDSPKNGQLEVHAYRTRVEVPVSSDLYPEGSVHTFDLTWRPDGTIIYAVDGVPKYTETAAAPLGPDSVFLSNDPHISIFSGGMAMSVYSVEVYQE